jgi:integrative and conjugative element protein (TIGR02256 family)
MTAAAASVLLTQAALDDMINAGRQALPHETGGILAGFRAGSQVVITRVAVVLDNSSTRRDYHLRHQQAGHQLDLLRAAAGVAVVGYVGDWHTHPADLPPSPLDHHSLTGIATTSSDLVALLVLPFAAGQALAPQALVGRSSRGSRVSTRRVDVSAAEVIISCSMAQDIEASADAAFQSKE